MAILYGTTSTGDTLPVQVDQAGRLVAEGLEGAPGPEGPEGPPGPTGPPIDLPPDPYEGALLGWLNGELAWVSGDPIPVPQEVFGPITNYEMSGLITVDSGIPAGIGTGVYLSQCTADGSPIRPNKSWDISGNWSQLITNGNFVGGTTPADGFDGTATTWAWSSSNFSLQGLTFNNVGVVQVKFYTGTEEEKSQGISVNGGSEYHWTKSDSWFAANRVSVPVNGSVSSIELLKRFHTRIGIRELWIDDLLLVDTDQSFLTAHVAMRRSDTQVLLDPIPSDPFTVGQYLKASSQQVAARVLYGNDPTSHIDYLRRKRD